MVVFFIDVSCLFETGERFGWLLLEVCLGIFSWKCSRT